MTVWANGVGRANEMEVLVRISQEELERQRYLERQRAERDYASLVADVRAAQEDLRAAQEDARVARKEARIALQKKGIRIGRIQMSQQLLNQPEMSLEELVTLPEPDLVQLEADLQRQLSDLKQANGAPPADKS